MVIIASISVVGLDIGPSVGKFVKIALDEMDKMGLKYHVSPMETSFEVKDMDHLCEVLKRVHHAVAMAGAKRIVITMKIDHRFDKEIDMEYKIKRAKGEI